jgi:LysM repeat protein
VLIVPPGGGLVRTAKSYERPGGNTEAGSSLVTVTTRGGETIAQIAARYNASVEEVARLNNETSTDAPLPRGRQIKVPTQSKAAPQAEAPARRR